MNYEKIGTHKLESERLILRKIEMNDVEKAFNNWCNSYEVSKYVLLNAHKDINETKKWFEFWIKDYQDLSTYRWIVELRKTKELIGIIDVASKKFMKYDACEIGYCYEKKILA